MSSQKVAEHMRTRLSTERPYAWWIGLNDRDHSSKYYWTDSSPVNYVGWVGYVSNYGMFKYRLFISDMLVYNFSSIYLLMIKGGLFDILSRFLTNENFVVL